MTEPTFSEPINLRHAEATDQEKILALMPYLADFAIPQKRQQEDLWSGDAERAKEILAGEISEAFLDVAVDSNDQIAGLIMVSMRKELLSHEPSAHLEAIIVNPGARGIGLGRRLMQHCETRVAALGARSLTLHVFARNERARALYAAEQFDEELIRAIKWMD